MSGAETRFRVDMCDGSIGVKGRVDSRADLDDLIARLRHAADGVWPQRRTAAADRPADRLAASAAPMEPAVVSHETAAPQDAPESKAAPGVEPLSFADAPAARMTRVRLSEIVAEQLSDHEFELLSSRQAEAVALRRHGCTLERAAAYMGLATSTAVVNLVNKARQRGVEVTREAAA